MRNKKGRCTFFFVFSFIAVSTTFVLSILSSASAAIIDVPFGLVNVGGKNYNLNFTYDDGPSADHTFNKLDPLITFTTQAAAEAARQVIIDMYLPNELPDTTPPMAYQGFYIPYETNTTHFSHVIAFDSYSDNIWNSWDLGHHTNVGRNDSVRVAIAEFSLVSDSDQGDVNGDGSVNLQDVIITLQVVAGMDISGNIFVESDVSDDQKIGLEESIYAIQVAGGLFYEPTTVTSTTGRVWMDRNLGASHVATSSTDSATYGYLYQWGRLNDGHQERLSDITAYDATSSEDMPGHSKFIIASADWRNPANNNLWQGLDGINNPCPEGFRVPTNDEWNAEIDTWQDKNSIGAFNSPLRLVVAGTRARNNGVRDGEDSSGHYWSSDIAATGAYYFSFDSFAGENSTYRAYGKSVRCIQN